MENDTLPIGLNSVYKKIHKCMEALTFIGKDKTNKFHNYDYASEFAIKKAVHEQLVAQKLILQLSQHSFAKDGNITTVIFNYAFVDIETGDKMEGVFSGTGEDKGDKGLYKAFTGCLKYLLTTTFLIPTGDDPEAAKDGEAAKEQPKQPVQQKAPTKPNATKEIVENYCAAILNGEIGMYEEVFEKYVVGTGGKKLLDEAKAKYKQLSGELS